MRTSSLCVLVVCSLVAALPAVAATPGSGHLAFAGVPVLEGSLAGNGAGEAHVTDVAASLGATGAKVDVLKVWYETEVFANPLGPVRTNTGPVQTEWRNFTAASLQLAAPQEGFEALVVAAGDARLSFPATDVAGPAPAAFAKPWLVVDDSGVEEQQREGEIRVFTYAADGDRFVSPPGSVSATGDLMVYLENTGFTVVREGGRVESFASGTFRTETSPASYKEAHVHHLVYIADASLALTGADAVAWLAEPTFTFDGTLTADEATGSIAMGEKRFTLDEEPLTVGGDLVFQPRPLGEPVTPKSESLHVGTSTRTDGQYGAMSSQLNGDVAVLAIGSQIPYVEEGGLAVAASVGVLTLVGAVLLLTPKGKWALLTVLAPLYAKTERSRLLDNESRDRIFQAIRNNPGINLSQVHRLAELGWGVTVYHLKMMEKNGLVFSETSARDKCFFENEPRFRALRAAIAAIANKEPAQRVAQAVVAHPGLTQRELIAHTGLTQRAVSYYVGKLAQQRLLEASRDGNYMRYHATERLDEALAFVSSQSTASLPVAPVQNAPIKA